jgi:hypothetical protein
MFQIFNCVDDGAGGLVIAQQPSIQCYSKPWRDFLSIDIVFIAVYLFVCPGIVILMYRRFKKTTDRKIEFQFLKPLTQFIRPGAEWFEFVKLIFRLNFVFVRDVLPVSSMFKLSFLGILLMVMIWIESKTRPYEQPQQNDFSLL